VPRAAPLLENAMRRVLIIRAGGGGA
jgi:hypothetical protein